MVGVGVGHDPFCNWDKEEHENNNKTPRDCKGFSQRVSLSRSSSERVGTALDFYPSPGRDTSVGRLRYPEKVLRGTRSLL